MIASQLRHERSEGHSIGAPLEPLAAAAQVGDIGRSALIHFL